MSPITFKQRVYQYCNRNWNGGRKSIIDHFLSEGVPKPTIYRIVKCWENGEAPERKSGSGRKAKIMTKTKVKRLINLIDHKSGISTRQLAKKFKCTQQYIVKTIKEKTQIHHRKRSLKPDRTAKQSAVIRPRCGRILKKFPAREFVIDDESYFTFKNSDKNANAGYWSSDVSHTSDDVRYRTKKKFEPKVLVWIAISPRGMSRPFFVKRGLGVDQKIYLQECVQKRLIPFLHQHHSDGNYVFWPDLASSHYAKSVIDHLRAENIAFVEKGDNPPAVPELRPIENFWSILKGHVYNGGWEATGDNDKEKERKLKRRIKLSLKKVDQKLIQAMVGDVAKKLDRVRRTGVI